MKIYTELNKLGKMPDRVEKRLQEWKLKNAGKRIEIEIKRQKTIRTLSQNAFLHGGLIPQVRDILRTMAKDRGDENYYGIDDETTKEWIKKKFLGYETKLILDEPEEFLKHTSKLDKYQFGEMIDNCVTFFTMKGYEIQLPEDYWNWLHKSGDGI